MIIRGINNAPKDGDFIGYIDSLQEQKLQDLKNSIREDNEVLKEELLQGKLKSQRIGNKIQAQILDNENVKPQKTREDVIRGLRDDIIVEDLSEEYTYGKFSEENIKAKYDTDNLLSENDMTAIQCLYGAIKEGNKEVYPRVDENKINMFLKEKPNNIVTTVNLMIQDAKKKFQRVDKEMIERYGITVNGLIPGSYTDVSNIIENYREQEKAQGIE